MLSITERRKDMSIKGMNEFKPIFPGNEENKNAGSKASCVTIS